METWPASKIARNIASFIGFFNFYSMYIPYLEQHNEPLRALTRLDMNQNVTALLTPRHESTKRDMIDTLCTNPYPACYNFEKRVYLLTKKIRKVSVLTFVNLTMTLALSLQYSAQL